MTRLWLARIGPPKTNPHNPPLQAESPFLYDDSFGYEPKPHTYLRNDDAFQEQSDADGFRGPERRLVKSDNTFRVLAIGDSVVQGLAVPYEQSWTRKLEEKLGKLMPTKRVEVINAGVGGYVAWQARSRLERRGLKYQPDLVLVHVGWNDLFYSSQPFWKLGTDLTKIEKAYINRPPAAEVSAEDGALKKILTKARENSALVQLVWNARNRLRQKKYEAELIQKRREKKERQIFNELALDAYENSLEEIRELTVKSGARLGIISWPTSVAPDTIYLEELHHKLVGAYQVFPLSAVEMREWYDQYRRAQLAFIEQNPDVIDVDAASLFEKIPPEKRIKFFSDNCHLESEGNTLFAEAIAKSLETAFLR